MLKFVVRRFLSAIPVLLIVLTLVFFMLRLIPGDPVSQLLPEDATNEEYEEMKIKLGLDGSLGSQYIRYMKNFLSGNWGTSLFNKQSVLVNIKNRMEPTIVLTLYSTVLFVIVGIPIGIIAARKRNSILDYSLTTLSVLGLSVPGFWLGLMMVFYLGVAMGLFPVQGYTPIAKGGLWKALYSLTMPAIALAFSHIASMTRYTRSMMLDVLHNDYIRTARAKGLIENKVYYKHALKNALAPVVTNVGFSMAAMLGGSTVIETVFNIPGMGKLAYESLMRRDYPQEQAIILLVATVFVVTNILLDIVYKALDPQIELD